MTSSGPFSASPASALFYARKPSARVEKSVGCGQLNGESGYEPPPSHHSYASAERRKLSHAETKETAPLWYGPRLRAPFVAQFIGQVLGTSHTMPEKTYAPAPDMRGRVIDKRA